MLDSHDRFVCPDSRRLDHFGNQMIVQDSVTGFGSILQLSLRVGKEPSC